MEETKKKHPLYYTWNGMMYRCYKEYHSHYKYYGARGVTVDERWHDFWNFVYDVDNYLLDGYLLYENGYDLDKDLKGGNTYSLNSCTVRLSEENREMSRKKQKKSVLAINEKENMVFDSLAETSKYLGINRSTVINCIRRRSRHKSGYNFKYID
ncbi:NUMOD1 domain-containing DNA-binding protein [Peribacillus frigoritolerans]|uniref:NUMOD1 domain-containing DNA-binding protein n=1 Tax=Peribacillus frigoritolerans TaxID=450367 RepID=UPI003F8323CD